MSLNALTNSISLLLALLSICCAPTPNDTSSRTRPTATGPKASNSAVAFTSDGTPLDYMYLNEHPVLGRLGQPLGTIVNVRAKIVAGRTYRASPQEMSRYFLLVSEIDKEVLAKPLRIAFVETPNVQLPNNEFDLCKLKTGKNHPSEVSAGRFAAIEGEYLGKDLLLAVYEQGLYSGVPLPLPKEFMMWEEHGFSFSTSVRVLAVRQWKGPGEAREGDQR